MSIALHQQVKALEQQVKELAARVAELERNAQAKPKRETLSLSKVAA